MRQYQFSSGVFIIGVNPYVPVSEKILEKLLVDASRKSGPIPVKGKVNGFAFSQTVVKYQGIWRLYINGSMMKGANVHLGDTIVVDLMFDPSDRSEKMPERLKLELKENKKAEKAFEELPPYRKKEILRYLNNLKSDGTLEKNITKVIKHLSGEKVEGLIALTYKRS